MSLTFPLTVLEEVRTRMTMRRRFANLPSATPDAVGVSKFAWYATLLQSAK